METVYKSMGAIVGFSVLVLLVQNFISDKASEYMVLLTLLTTLLMNTDKIVNIANKFTV